MAPANFVITLLGLLFGYVGECFFFIIYLFLNDDHLFWLEIYNIHRHTLHMVWTVVWGLSSTSIFKISIVDLHQLMATDNNKCLMVQIPRQTLNYYIIYYLYNPY